MITDVNKKWAATLVDDAIKLKGILELIDGYLAKIAINFIDNLAEKKLNPSDELVGKINKMLDLTREAEYDEASELGSEILNDLIDIPGIDEEGEALLFESFVKLIVGAAKLYISKQS